MPFPPPPAEALIKIGKPISLALVFANFISVMALSVPSIIGMLYSFTAAFAASLLPITSIASGEGPMKVIPLSETSRANSAFSDKNP